MFRKDRKQRDREPEDVRAVMEISDSADAAAVLGAHENAPYAPPPDERYLRLSRRLRTAKFAVLTLFIVFLLGMITVFSEEITTEHLRYILKELNISLSSSGDDYGELLYTSDSEMNFALFRSDLVCVGRESVEVIDRTGAHILSRQLRYAKPKLLTSDNYLLVYDLSGYKLSLYNAFSCVYEETFPYPISDASMNGGGMFMLATRTDIYRTAVYIYNRNFDQIYRWYSNDKFIFDMLLSDNGKDFLLFCAYAKDGAFYTEILSGNVGSETLTTVYEQADTLVLSAAYTSEGNFSVFCDSKALFFTEDGQLLRSYSYGSETPVYCSTGDGKTAIILKSSAVGQPKSLVVFDGDGNIVAETPLSADTSKVLLYEGGAFLLQSDRVVRFDLSARTKTEYITGQNVIDMIAEEGTLFLLTGTRAYPLKIGEIFAP